MSEPRRHAAGGRFTPGHGDTADPDVRILSDKDLEEAVKAGEQRG